MPNATRVMQTVALTDAFTSNSCCCCCCNAFTALHTCMWLLLLMLLVTSLVVAASIQPRPTFFGRFSQFYLVYFLLLLFHLPLYSFTALLLQRFSEFKCLQCLWRICANACTRQVKTLVCCVGGMRSAITWHLLAST